MTRKIIYFVFYLLLSHYGLAQQPYAIHIDKSRGLPSNEIFDIYQDKKGFVWIAGNQGLSRFDGLTVKNYTYSNQYSRAGNQIMEDPYGRIWYVSFDNYLYYVQNDSLHVFNDQPGVNHIYGIADHTLFFLTQTSLDFYDLKSLSRFKQMAMFTGDIGFAHVLNDLLVIRKSNTLTIYNSKGELSASIPLNKQYIHSEHPFIFNHQLHLVDNYPGSKQIVRYDGKFMPTGIRFHSMVKKAVLFDSLLMAAENDRLSVFDIKSFQLRQTLFQGERPSCMMRDRDGHFWIGTLDNGLYIIPDLHQLTYPLPEKKICLSKVIDHKLYLGSTTGEVYQVNAADMNVNKIFTTTNHQEIYDLVYLPGNQYIEPHFRNGFKYDKGMIQIVSGGLKSVAYIDPKYLAAAYSSSAVLLNRNRSDSLTSLFDELYYSRPIDPALFPNASVLLDGVRAKSTAYIPEEHKVYYATNLGIRWFAPKEKGHLLWNKKEIYCSTILQHQQTLFCLTHGGELLIRTADSRIRRYENLQQIERIKICDHHLFVQHASGIFHADLEEISTSMDSNFLKQLPLMMNSSQILDINVWENEIIFITREGLIRSEFTHHSFRPAFYITSINQKPYTPERIYRFPTKQNDLEISYAIPDYLQPQGHILSYRINHGIWKQSPSDVRKITLASLEPEDYLIEFKLDNELLPNQLKFKIEKPWYKTFGSWLTIFALFAFIILFIYRWQLRQQKEKNNLEMEKMQLENSLKQSMMSSIKSQMNPHFLFNALNTIQSFIISEDKRNASTYLSKFSKLTRRILEMSEKEKISLDEEVDALKLYLDLEKIRFEQMEYTITVDSLLNTESVFIPSMIIQPYVENAIKHGLLHKKGPKKLHISFKKFDSNILEIVIDDNGIGRMRSHELNLIKNKDHQSFALQANQKRLDILNQDNQDIHISFTDKTDYDQQPSGTTVTIHIPIQ
ncbi:MAG: histidine kinase [Chitinophagaceae bacterium]|nr:histidine kinase [Chitinophagaceae bacterium]